MQFYLAIVIDQNAYLKYNLKSFSSLEELDRYTTNFKNSKEIKYNYQVDISLFLKRYDSYLSNFKKKNNGRLCVFGYDLQNNIRFFPVLYKEHEELLNLENSVLKIKNALDDYNVLFSIYNRKKYLLTKFEKEVLANYLYTKNNRYKDVFVLTFISRIKSSSNCYLYIRSLMNVSSLLDINKNLNSNILKKIR